MFKRLLNWIRGKKPEPEMVTIWGIESTPWGSGIEGYPQGKLVALREVPASSLPKVSKSGVFAHPSPPRRLKQHGLSNDPAEVKKRHRAWLIGNLPDEAMFGR